MRALSFPPNAFTFGKLWTEFGKAELCYHFSAIGHWQRPFEIPVKDVEKKKTISLVLISANLFNHLFLSLNLKKRRREGWPGAEEEDFHLIFCVKSHFPDAAAVAATPTALRRKKTTKARSQWRNLKGGKPLNVHHQSELNL